MKAQSSFFGFSEVTLLPVRNFDLVLKVLPLENKMKNSNHAKPVVYSAMVMVILLYFIFGTTGYIVYGSNIEASITLNLKSSTRLGAAM